MSQSGSKEPPKEGEIIQKHLENVYMDPWYIIYKVYVNPSVKNEKKKKD